MKKEQAKRIIEALLFASERPLSIEQIEEVLEQFDAQAIKAVIEELKNEYQTSARSFNIAEVAGGYQIATDPQYASWLQKLYRKSRTEKLTRPSLETLAIVAYRQPITRTEIEDIRGVNVDGVLKTLLDRSLVRITGRKQIPGRPFLYSTSRQFMEFFGLNSLEDLPKLEDFQELAKRGEEHEEVEKLTQENRPN